MQETLTKSRGSKRANKADAIRKSLFEAAAVVVGRDGYLDASIAKITALAGVASGTFYNYFENRQDLFNKLLPEVGDAIIGFIRYQVKGCPPGLQTERRRLEAYFEYFEQNPGFIRLLNEAEVFAPAAFEEHIQRFAIRYLRALQGDREEGLLADFDDKQLEAVVFMLMGCRTYLTLLLNRSNKYSPADLVDAYLKLIGSSLYKNNASRLE